MMRHRTVIHESGHAVVSWHYSTRNYDKPPFTTIKILNEADADGTVKAVVNMKWETITSDPVETGAIVLAGLFAQEEAYHWRGSQWIGFLNEVDGTTGGVDDLLNAMEVAKKHSVEWTAFADSVRCALQSISGMESLVETIAKVLEAKDMISITDKNVRDILDSYKN